MDLIKRESFNLAPTYQTMIQKVKEYYPVIKQHTDNFNKSQSQFMDNMFTVTQLTEIRSARQILAEYERAKMALDEAYFNMEKKKIEIAKKQFELENKEIDLLEPELTNRDKKSIEFDKKLLELEIKELESGISNSMGYIEGAVRKVSAYTTQFQNILKKYGKDHFTEEDFELDEERYHIMKVFEQALCAARAHGRVDEGNHIYFFQLGISGMAGQYEIVKYLEEEANILRQTGSPPSHEMTINWLHAMSHKYKGCAEKFVKIKGMTLITQDSLHLEYSKEE